MKKISILFAVSLLASTSSIAFAKTNKLSVSIDATAHYQCDNGSKVTASYYHLSDDSLSFVKLTIKNEAYTLPQVVSASGVRYTDEHKVEWFTKEDEALLTEEVYDKNSKIINCKEIAATKKK